MLLKRIGVFLTTQELTPVYNVFDTNRDGKINFNEFVQTLRNSMSDERIATVKKTFDKLDKSRQGRIPVGQLIANYNADLHPRVRTREKNAQQVEQEFQRAISRKAHEGFISEMDFLDYYADVSACLPTEREDHFNNILHSTWAPKGSRGYMVSSDRVLDIENRIFEKIRQLTVDKENEGTTLRRRFSAIDKFSLGIVDFPQFRKAMHELGFGFPDEELQAVFDKFTGGKEKLVYSELCDYFRDLGVGIPPNLNPAYTMYRRNPDDVLEKLKKELRSKGSFQIGRLRRIFLRSDKDRSGYLSRDEFSWAMKEIGIQMSKPDYEKIFRHFDRNSDNKVSYQEFVSSLVPTLSPSREQHCQDLFTRLASSTDGTISSARLSQCFDPRNDPEVVFI